MSTKIHIPWVGSKPAVVSPSLFGEGEHGRRRGLEPTFAWTLSSRMPIIALFLLCFVLFTGWLARLKTSVSDAGFFSSAPAQVAPWQQQTQTQFFSAGATKTEVRAIQGMPSWVQGDAWYYGSSQVRFRNGKVRGWTNSPDDPLRVRMVPPAASAAVVVAPIRIGASKDDVLRLHGTPGRLDEDVWEYGSSKVFFRGGRVVGWSDSPASPLQVDRRGPAQDRASGGDAQPPGRVEAARRAASPPMQSR